MSKDELTYLVDFLGKRFDRIDQRFDALEARIGRLEVRMDRLEARFDDLERRVVRLELLFEQFRHDTGAIGELARGNADRLGRIEERLSA